MSRFGPSVDCSQCGGTFYWLETCETCGKEFCTICATEHEMHCCSSNEDENEYEEKC